MMPTRNINITGELIFFFFFFLKCPHKKGRGIRTSDLRFIRRDPSRLNYLLGDYRRIVLTIPCSVEKHKLLHSTMKVHSLMRQ
jgi:hypothetical protein